MKGLRTVLVAAAIGLLAMPAFASNMGFKLTKNLKAPSGSAASNWTSIPWFASYTDASSLRADVGNTAQIWKYNFATNSLIRWQGGGAGQSNFAIVQGEAYDIRVAADNSWVVVGSHDNSKTLNLKAPVGSAASNWVGVPYHTTATDASALRVQVGSTAQIWKYNFATNSLVRWQGGGAGQSNFAILPGEGYDIRVAADTSWLPAHY